MKLLVTYDVSTVDEPGRKRLRKVAQICVNHGQRVQNSVFECMLDEAQKEEMVRQLLRIVAPTEDSLRIYRLLDSESFQCEHYGKKPSIDFNGPLIV